MKFIALKVRRQTHKVAEQDIKKIFMKAIKKTPALPSFDGDNFKTGCSFLTETEEDNHQQTHSASVAS